MSDFSPHRVVSLQPSATDMLARLGVLDRVVACTRHCLLVCPELEKKPTQAKEAWVRHPALVEQAERLTIADSWSAQADEILAARPDLVVASVPYQTEAVAQILKAGVRFLGFAPRRLEDIYSDIALLAGVMNAGDRGRQLIAEMQQEIEAVRRRAQTAARPRVFCEEWGRPIMASEPWVAELVEAAGARFLGEPGRRIEPQAVRDADPEIIIFAWTGTGDRVPAGTIIAERGWRGTSAAKYGRVYVVRDELLNTPGPTLIKGIKALAWTLHPELFPRSEGVQQMG